MAMIANVSREVPDPGQAAWVSANDKPTAPQGSKPVTGDAAERLLKGGVMQLPARDRRRIKDLSHNDFEPQQELANVFSDIRRKPAPAPELAQSATGVMSNMNFDIEIRKRYNAPLAIESGEFPDSNVVSGRMLPLCYEAGLASGHSPEAPQLLTVAVETFIKENLATIFSRTRSNGPGDAGNAGFGVGINWIQTAQYSKQLHLEENLAQNGRLTRDKNGLLPVEAKAASERGPLTVADLRLAIEVGETGFSHFPALRTQILQGYREGELENYNEYSYVSGHETTDQADEYVPALVNGEADAPVLNGMGEPMDVDTTLEWEGAEDGDIDLLDNVLDQILVGT
ncbi:Transcriptional coactivator-like protein [Emericellopsis cladophorae]|uniref:Transcriptional coactivator-like protein n=1 Tax=Emericellopsis cladophorae TaxID=2686198 RepID=A0A9P9Y214_9HYPO|nr:Transcriptional coactivator-like protein [Emericellopsis cladophorae]KAI6782051.1 Transcriptional coactivator-like protein [Emericellopsis cladophorae]